MPSRRLAAAVPAVLLAVGLGACASAGVQSEPAAARRPRAPTAPAPPDTPAPAPVAVEAAVFPPLLLQTTRPAPAGADLYLPEPVTAYGRLEIPGIGVDVAAFEGLTLTVIDHGPAHWPGTAAPGELGNAVYAGHRVTRSRPFNRIDELVAGDRVFATGPHGRFEYSISEVFVVTPNDLWVAAPTPVGTITLFACHPKGSARERIVARATLVGPA